MIGIEPAPRKRGFIQGCVVPILAVIGLVVGCYLICLVLFLLNQSVGGA